MAREIYDKSWWGQPQDGGWGDIYYDFFASSDLGGISTSMEFTPAASVASGAINANKPASEALTFTRASVATFVGSNTYIQDSASGVPRIDYLGNSAGHLLLEPQRTNLYPYHTLRLNTSQVNASKNTNTTEVTSPANDNTATKVTTADKGTGGKAGIVAKTAEGTNHNFTASTDYTASVFVKKLDFDFIQLICENFSGLADTNVYFNVSTGAVGTETNATGFIEDYGNGWYRCAMKFNLGTNADLSGRVLFRFADGDGDNSVPRDGTDSMYFWGAQLEEGSYPTSLIKTSGSAVTRSADAASGAGDSTLFNDSEGTIVAEYAALADDQTNRFFGISDGTDDERVLLGYGSASTNRIRAIITNAGSSTAVLTNAENSITDFNKVAVKYKEDDVALWINGSEAETDTDAAMPSGLNEFLLDSGSGASDFYGKIKSIKIYKSALSDEDLTTETS
tara:strand:- start:781 stop:2136 length:1356 start_codon:yes stop_codon:yes gene_type:complete